MMKEEKAPFYWENGVHSLPLQLFGCTVQHWTSETESETQPDQLKQQCRQMLTYRQNRPGLLSAVLFSCFGLCTGFTMLSATANGCITFSLGDGGCGLAGSSLTE